LRSAGIADNTIVVFTSDNGGERFADTWPFSGRKTELLEGGLRIPAIVSWPAVLPKNKTSEQVAISMDWLPTLLDAVGAGADPAFAPDGISLLPVLRGDSAPVRRTLFWRYKGNAQRAVRDGDLKYLKIRENTFLFNVADDPMERANLKDRQKDVYEALSRKWLDWNATMLPEVPESNTGGNNANTWADHIGNTSTRQPDNP
jgi:arylsulfatase A-like enzyme